MWHKYYSVTSISEALELLSEHGAKARIISGGTDILIELERGLRPEVEALIDISRVPGLDEIKYSEDMLELGPLVTHNHVVGNELTRQYALPLAQAAWEVGAPQIRNRGTVAGNIITASPANDTITPLAALDAVVTLTSSEGERRVALGDFYTGYRQTVMQPDEMLTAIKVPAMQEDQAGIFLKLGLRRAQAISVLNVAIILAFEDPEDRRSKITRAAVALGCVAPTIIRLPEVETFLTGKELTDETISEAANWAASIAQPIDDIRSTADYRTNAIKVYVGRALRKLSNGEERANFPQNPAMLWGTDKGLVKKSLPQAVQHERSHAETMTMTVNGKSHTVTGGTHKTLLRFLREDLNLTGTKEGCAEGECGACTVFLDGVAVMACMVPAPRVHGANIVTIEGLANENGQLHPLQQSFVNCGAVQCGYCTPGFLMSGAKLFEEHPQPTRSQIEQTISGNLCRCTGYYKILEAFEQTSID